MSKKIIQGRESNIESVIRICRKTLGEHLGRLTAINLGTPYVKSTVKATSSLVNLFGTNLNF